MLQPFSARTNPRQGSIPSEADVFSCDVFDTLITRAVGQPSSLFLLLGRRVTAQGLIEGSAWAFSQARQEANRRANANGSGSPHNLRAIYDELQFALGLDDSTTQAILAAEVALEKDLSRAIPGAADRLARAREAGMRIVFLSDMYLDTTVVQSLLDAHGMMGDGEPLLISCETGYSKTSGQAFHRLAASEAVPVNRILHRGNDDRSDVAAAVRAGAGAEAFPAGNLNRYELAMEARAHQTDGLACLMAGASRLARLSVSARTPEEAALRDAAAGVGDPALVSYVLWVLQRARDLGLRRLYFLARDGRVLLLIAQRLVPRLGLDIELRYLHGGRQAWYVPSIIDVSPESVFWAIDYASENDGIETFLRRVGVEATDVEEQLGELGLPPSTWKTPRPPAEHDILWSIARHPVIRQLILERARERREAALGYFEQEGLLDDSDWAVVDVGWSGRLLGAMNRILETRAATIPAAFFFARHVDREKHQLPPVKILPFMGDYHHRLGLCGEINELFLELFCGSNEGVTTGYRRGESGWDAVLGNGSHHPLAAWGIDIVHDTMLTFVDQLWLDPEVTVLTADMRPAVVELVRAFVDSPTPHEALAWGSYPFEYGRNGTVSAALATPLNLGQLPRILKTGRPRTRTGTEWAQASMLITPEPVRSLLHGTLGLRRGAGAVLRAARRLFPYPRPSPEQKHE
ncbi:hypothetical protein BH23GEM11_BH23GEM11_06060 [soil metagenome]